MVCKNQVKAYLKMSKKLKLTLGLYMNSEQLERYCLEQGVQPANIMTVVIMKTKDKDKLNDTSIVIGRFTPEQQAEQNVSNKFERESD